MSIEETTILLTGYAPAPKGTVMQEKQRLFGVVLEVDLRTHRIINADVPGVTDLSRDFFKRVAIGYDMSKGVGRLCDKVRARYWTSSTDSLVACLRLISQRYEEGLKRLYSDALEADSPDNLQSGYRMSRRGLQRNCNVGSHA